MEDAKKDLARRGLMIENAVPGPIPFISGTILLGSATELTTVNEVKKIEQDSKVYAL